VHSINAPALAGRYDSISKYSRYHHCNSRTTLDWLTPPPQPTCNPPPAKDGEKHNFTNRTAQPLDPPVHHPHNCERDGSACVDRERWQPITAAREVLRQERLGEGGGCLLCPSSVARQKTLEEQWHGAGRTDGETWEEEDASLMRV
jgi:hypothetical protein